MIILNAQSAFGHMQEYKGVYWNLLKLTTSYFLEIDHLKFEVNRNKR